MEKIVCVGKNFLEHARELGDAVPEKPVLFLKPPSILRVATSPDDVLELCIPRDAGTVHHEVEIVLRLDKGGYRVDAKEAERLIGAVTLGLDMTLRDRQQAQKKAGHPWTTSKVFIDSAIVGPWMRVSEFPNYLQEKFSLALDSRLAQQGFGKDMSFSPAECVAYISEFFPLCAGDLIFTGTPAGVGPVNPGQKGNLQWGPIQYSVMWKSEA